MLHLEEVENFKWFRKLHVVEILSALNNLLSSLF